MKWINGLLIVITVIYVSVMSNIFLPQIIEVPNKYPHTFISKEILLVYLLSLLPLILLWILYTVISYLIKKHKEEKDKRVTIINDSIKKVGNRKSLKNIFIIILIILLLSFLFLYLYSFLIPLMFSQNKNEEEYIAWDIEPISRKKIFTWEREYLDRECSKLGGKAYYYRYMGDDFRSVTCHLPYPDYGKSCSSHEECMGYCESSVCSEFPDEWVADIGIFF